MKTKKVIQNFEVLENMQLSDAHFVLKLISPTLLPEMLPGQFAEVLVPGTTSVFLRRPLSIHDYDSKKNTFSFFVKCVGEGTSQLKKICKGEIINIILPLGKGFDLNVNGNALLAGGGCGIAPLYFLAKELTKKKTKCDILIGAKSKNEFSILDEFKKFGTVHIITEDGTLGEKGLATDHSVLKNGLEDFSKVFSCGPEPMMKAVAALTKGRNIECEVSLENTMACGIGACLCCVTETVKGHQCVCTDGPVFNVKELVW